MTQTLQSPFDYTRRAVVCACGQALVGSPGAAGACMTCGSRVSFGPRSPGLPLAALPGPQPEALRAQVAVELDVPAAIAFLWERGSVIPPHRRAEALVAWQGSRKRAPDDVAAGEELVALTRELASAAERAGDAWMARALVESAIDAAPLPRQRNALVGGLVRMAARANDLQSAKRWLAEFHSADDLSPTRNDESPRPWLRR